MLKSLLKQRFEVTEPYPETTANIDLLFSSLNKHDYGTMYQLLSNKKVSSGTVNYADKSRPSLLIECCKRSDQKLLQMIIRLERDQVKILHEDALGHRAVWYAIEKNFQVAIHDLLEHKLMDPNLHDTKTSLTPLLQAIERKHLEIVINLIRAGADVSMPPRDPKYHGLTPLVLSIVNGTEEISQCLINSLCNLNQIVADGNGPDRLHSINIKRCSFIPRPLLIVIKQEMRLKKLDNYF